MRGCIITLDAERLDETEKESRLEKIRSLFVPEQRDAMTIMAKSAEKRGHGGGTPAKGGPCFVATAVYSSPSHQSVCVLREWRDEKFLSTQLGRYFVDFYYLVGPPLSRIVERHPLLRNAARKGLDRLVDRVKTLNGKKNEVVQQRLLR